MQNLLDNPMLIVTFALILLVIVAVVIVVVLFVVRTARSTQRGRGPHEGGPSR